MQNLQDNQWNIYGKLTANPGFTVLDCSTIGNAYNSSYGLIYSKQSCYFCLYYRNWLIVNLFFSGMDQVYFCNYTAASVVFLGLENLFWNWTLYEAGLFCF